MSNLPQVIDQKALSRISAVVDECNINVLRTMSSLECAFRTASGIKALKAALTNEVMAPIAELMDTPLGFMTDKANGSNKYPVEVVRDCLIQALITGVRITDNEFNIISGRTYIAKNGMKRLVRSIDGLTDLRVNYGVPTMKNGGAAVPCDASWRIRGVPDKLTCEVPVKVNSGMGVDAILGKADRKLHHRIYERIVGSEFTPQDGEIDDGPQTKYVSNQAQQRQEVAAQLEAALETADDLAHPPTIEGEVITGPPADLLTPPVSDSEKMADKFRSLKNKPNNVAAFTH